MKKVLNKIIAILLIAIIAVNIFNIHTTAAKIKVKKIKLNKTKITMKVGKKTNLKAKVKPAKLKKSLKWKSSNTKVATVSKGKVSAIRIGKATITAYSGKKKAKCKITVKKSSKKSRGNNSRKKTVKKISAKNLIPNGESLSGIITETTENVWYKIVLSKPGTLFLRVTSRIHEISINWLNNELQEIRDDNIYYGSDESPKIYKGYMDLEAGTYYIKISKYSSYTGTYNIKALFSESNNNEIEPNNIPEQAQSMKFDQIVKGFISYQDNTDYYKYVLPSAGKLTVRLTSRIRELNLDWLNSEYQQLGGNEIIYYGSDESPKIYGKYMNLEAGVYYIKAHKYDNYTGTYDLKATFTSANNNEVEPNNIPEQVQMISKGQSLRGFISYQDSTDYYKVVLTSSIEINLKLISRIREVNLFLLDSEYQQIKDYNIYYGSNESPEILDKTMDLSAGTYYIKVHKYGNYTGTYDLSIS